MKKGINRTGTALALAAAMAGSYIAGKSQSGERPAVTGQATVYRVSGGENVDSTSSPNLVLPIGARQLWRLFTGDSANHYDADAFLGVGNSATASDTTMTGLQGDSVAYKNVDSIVYGQNFVEYYETFITDEANFSWQEFCLYNDSDKICFDRVTSAVGPKTTADTFTLKLKLSID